MTTKTTVTAIMPLDEFRSRFVAHMVAAIGETFDDGLPVAEYAAETAKSYWDEQHHQDGASPEECADDEMYYAGQDAA